jgi:hypothetical protein
MQLNSDTERNHVSFLMLFIKPIAGVCRATCEIIKLPENIQENNCITME